MALKTQDFTAEVTKAGISYTFILRVTQNSVDAELNCSNITVDAILKSDKEGTSFYFQYLEVYAYLSGTKVIGASAYRTCKGTEEHLYETWTGDIEHDENGDLEFTVSGSIAALASAASFMPFASIDEQSFVCESIVRNSPPEIPQGLTAPPLVAAGGDVLLQWQVPEDSDGNLAGYELERSDDGGESFLQLYSGSNAEFPDEASAAEGLEMLYRVRAYDEKGAYSDWSESVAVIVNTAPSCAKEPALFMDQAGMAPAGAITTGRPLWLYPGRWIDPDKNLDGGAVVVEVRTEARDGSVGEWAVLQIYPIAEQMLQLLPDEPDSAGCIQYRVACRDVLGAQSEWAELPWVQLNVAYSFCDGQWMKPALSYPVMPFVRIGEAWARHGGLIPDPESSRLGFGKLGEMILGG